MGAKTKEITKYKAKNERNEDKEREKQVNRTSARQTISIHHEIFQSFAPKRNHPSEV